MIRCKFKVTENGSGTVRMEPVTSGSEENEKFFAATPAGHFHLHCTRPEVTALLAVGGEVFIDIQPAPATVTTMPASPVEPAKPPRKGRRGGKAAPVS